MAKQSNEKSKPCLPCYTKIQNTEEVDDGLVGVKLFDLRPSNLAKPYQNPERYNLRPVPATYAEGTVIVGSATFLNKYSQLVGIAKAMSGGPNFVDTRDNKIEIHNGKQSGKTVFAYTYAGGTGELLEFQVKTKYVQSIEAGKASSVDPDTKTVETDLVQCVPTNDDPCKPDAYVRRNKATPLLIQRDVTRMSKIKGSLEPLDFMCRKVNTELFRSIQVPDTVYESLEDAQRSIASNPSLTSEEVNDYNHQIEAEWNDYLNKLSEYEKALLDFKNKIRQGIEVDEKDTPKLPLPPDEVSYFVIHRRVKVMLDPYKFVPKELRSMYGGYPAYWEAGFRALKKMSNITIIYPTEGRYSSGDIYGPNGDKVQVEMDLEVQVPGVRVVSDPLFATLGEFMSNDIIESVNSQIKSKAKFVGNPLMKSSQIIEIKNVGERYSGDWYAKEVEHSFDTGGYFTEVTFEKKSRNSIVNKISTSVNMQEVFQKSHNIAKESYTTDAWKIPSKIKSEARKYRESIWKDEYYRTGANPDVGTQIVVHQDTDPTKWEIFDARTDFRVDKNISPKDQ